MAANSKARPAQTVEAQLAISSLPQKKLERDYRRLIASVDLIKAIGGVWGPQSNP
jgi:outer membrane protein TolC